MRRRRLLAALFLSAAVSLAADWAKVYDTRIAESLACRQAVAQLGQAELRLAQKERVYLPYLGIRTVGQNGVGLVDGGLAGGIAANLRFENLLGADLTFEVPLAFAGSSAGFGDPSVTLSRRVFEEPRVELLRARAAVLRARGAVEKVELDVRFGLVSDVLDAYRSVRVLESHRRDLGILERLHAASSVAEDLRALQRRILQARRAILQAETALQGIGADIRSGIEGLYAELLERTAAWVRDLPETGNLPEGSAEIDAQRLELEAVERARALAFLPYLPNPTLKGSLGYDPAARALSWGVFLVLSLDVIDRGERRAASVLRREAPALERARLQSLTRTLERGVASAWSTLAILDLDRQIQELDVEDARDEAKRLNALFARGFVTEEVLVMGEIDLSVAELGALEIEHNYLKQQLKLLEYFGNPSRGRVR